LADTTSKLKKLSGSDDDTQPSLSQKTAVLKEKVQSIVAPKMAEEALSQALNIK